ncbi:MAG: xanthine dehydrogenase accessory protein XdhC [Bdellovibrio sp.]|jgi:xanthine dehydrogenase accessory factor
MTEKNFELFLDQCQRLREKRQAYVVVTLVETQGSSPQDVGARMIVTAEGLRFGTVGGGKVENAAILKGQEFLKSENEQPQLIRWNLQVDLKMSCGGAVSFFFEKVTPLRKWKIAVFGAGHVAQELAPLLLKLDCDLTVIDSRSEWLEKVQAHARLRTELWPEMPKKVAELEPGTFVVLMTMGHSTDLPVLKELIQHSFPYIGVIGSDLKARKIRAELLEMGAPPARVDQIYCPIGETFGNHSPVEIAFSIVAQLLKVRDHLWREQS